MFKTVICYASQINADLLRYHKFSSTLILPNGVVLRIKFVVQKETRKYPEHKSLGSNNLERETKQLAITSSTIRRKDQNRQ